MRLLPLFVFCSVVLLAACQGPMVTQIGMSERQWVRGTPGANLLGEDGKTKVWHSEGAYYRFVDGKLAKIDRAVPRVQATLVEEAPTN